MSLCIDATMKADTNPYMHTKQHGTNRLLVYVHTQKLRSPCNKPAATHDVHTFITPSPTAHHQHS